MYNKRYPLIIMLSSLFLGSISGTMIASSGIACFLANHEDANLSMKPVNSVMRDLINKHLIENAQNIKILDLSNNGWNSDAFISFTNEVTSAKLHFKKLRYLVLRENRLDQAAAKALLFWLKLEKLRYINLVANPLGLKHIDLLFQALETMRLPKNETLSYLAKVIFMESNYVRIASNQVQVYARLVQQGHLPADWAQRHLEFYSSRLFKDNKRYSKNSLFAKALRSILSSSSPQKDHANDGELLSLTEGLSSLSLNEEEGSKSDVDDDVEDDGDDHESD